MKCTIVPVTAYQQNCTVILCEKTGKIAVTDPGGDIEKIQQVVDELGGIPEKILLTHAHMDHCAAADLLRKKWGVPIEGPQEEDRFWLEKLPEWCAKAGFPHAEPFEPDRWLNDGDVVTVGDESFEVLFCPGHTPGHIVFFHREQQLAWVGDVLFQGSIGRTDFPRGDYDTLIKSIREKLWPLGDDVTFIPGHGPVSNFGHERATNPFVADKRYS
jgi:hydroxyacylglutathione hydrolase